MSTVDDLYISLVVHASHGNIDDNLIMSEEQSCYFFFAFFPGIPNQSISIIQVLIRILSNPHIFNALKTLDMPFICKYFTRGYRALLF